MMDLEKVKNWTPGVNDTIVVVTTIMTFVTTFGAGYEHVRVPHCEDFDHAFYNESLGSVTTSTPSDVMTKLDNKGWDNITVKQYPETFTYPFINERQTMVINHVQAECGTLD